MAYAGVPSTPGLDPARAGLAGLEAGVRALDPATRALLDLSLRRRLRDDDMAPLLRIDSFNLAWRRARAIERLAAGLGPPHAGGRAPGRAGPRPHRRVRARAAPRGAALRPRARVARAASAARGRRGRRGRGRHDGVR